MIIYDTNFPFRFGTKIRKAEGFLKEFRRGNYDGIQLIGDPNSNFLSAFTHFFYTHGINVYSIHLTKSDYYGPNRILSERFSREIVRIPYFLHEYNQQIHPKFKPYGNLLLIPRWGISKLSLLYIQPLWKYIQNIYKIDTLFLDIGSGLTYLSALDFFRNSEITIIGLCIGLPRRKMVGYLEELELSLFGRVSGYSLEDVTGKFGSITDTDIQKLQEFRNQGISLEPIYSLKSISKIVGIERDLGNSAYLHQGGFLTGISRGV